MIDGILDIMETIVDCLFNWTSSLFYGIVFISILTTVPVWILPFLIWKRYKRKDRDDEDDVYDDWDEYTSATR